MIVLDKLAQEMDNVMISSAITNVNVILVSKEEIVKLVSNDHNIWLYI